LSVNPETGKVLRSGVNGNWWADVEKPMWVSSEEQSFKKTLVKRVWGTLPKLPKHKYLDEQMIIASKAIAASPDVHGSADPDEMVFAANQTEPENNANTQEQDFSQFSNIENEPGLKQNEQVDTKTGEVTEKQPAKSRAKKTDKVEPAKTEPSPNTGVAPETVAPPAKEEIEDAVIVEDETPAEHTEGAVKLDDSDLEGDSF